MQVAHLAGWRHSTAPAYTSGSSAAIYNQSRDGSIASPSSSGDASAMAAVAEGDSPFDRADPHGAGQPPALSRQPGPDGPLYAPFWQLAGPSHPQLHHWWGNDGVAGSRTAARQLHSCSGGAGGSAADSRCWPRQLHSVTDAASSPADHRRCSSRQVCSGSDPVSACSYSHGSVYASLTSNTPGRHMHSEPAGDGASAAAAAARGAARTTWLDRYLPRGLLPFAHLIRLDKPIGERDQCMAGRPTSCFFQHVFAS